MIKVILGLFVLTFSFSAFPNQEDADEKKDNWNNIQMPFNYQNIQVPREAWNNLKDILREDGAKEENIENFVISPISVSVEITSDEGFVLKDKMNQRILFTEGGGELDLFDFVQGRGQFYLRFAPHLVSGQNFHMIYLSDSPGKRIEKDLWGNGCGNMYDLSQSAHRFLTEPGMLLTTSKRHYLHLMAGVFIFFQLVDERLFLGYIRIKDSRYPNFNCKPS